MAVILCDRLSRNKQLPFVLNAVGGVVIPRRARDHAQNLSVALCCSIPSRISCACAAIVCLSFAMDSPEVEPRRFTFFFGSFLFMLQNKTRLEIPVRVNAAYKGATGNGQS